MINDKYFFLPDILPVPKRVGIFQSPNKGLKQINDCKDVYIFYV